MEQKTERQLTRFIAFGCIAIWVDAGLYWFLMNLAGVGIAKALGFIGGTTLAYFLNSRYTFQARPEVSGVLRFIILYTTSLGLNVWINHFVLGLSANFILAYLLAVLASTVYNFLGQKFWVFRKA